MSETLPLNTKSVFILSHKIFKIIFLLFVFYLIFLLLSENKFGPLLPFLASLFSCFIVMNQRKNMYEKSFYSLGEKALVYQKNGYFGFQSKEIIHYSDIQSLFVKQFWWSRLYGLASIDIMGYNSNSSLISIDDISNHQQVYEFLLKKLETKNT